jgi:hypothetical protein
MFDTEKVLEASSRGISNCIYDIYGEIGYFTDIEDNVFLVDIYDSPSRVINKMSDEEAQKHLLKSIEVDFSDVKSNYNLESAIIDKIVSTIEIIVYKCE